jgi:alpha-ketoglutarate-dependent taurine dioxygenase
LSGQRTNVAARAWQASDIHDPSAWTYSLSAGMVEELDRAMRAARAAGKAIPDLARADFDIPSFAADGEALREEVQRGRGFVVIRGLPIDDYTQEEAAMLYWGIAVHLGEPIPQNARNEYLFWVRDEGYNFERDYGAAGVRISRTASAIDFHTDSSAAYAGRTPDIVSLLALQVARSGGETAILSAQTVHDILHRERPDVLRRLCEPFYFDRRAELKEGQSATISAPVFEFDPTVSIRYFRFNLMKGHDTAGVALTGAEIDALDCLESVFRRPGLAVHFGMGRGDMQFVNNRFVLHSRTAFEDHDDPERRRNFLRLWMRYRDR